jgi:Spy/CpxP family protein refolding chaperone
MMKRTVLAIFVAAAVIMAFTPMAFAQTTAPKTVTLAKAAKLGPVTFDHATHQAMKGVDCTQCHATKAGGKVKEGMFHPTKPAPSMSGGCIDCHKKPENAKAPKGCTGCHKKAAV